jgi:hypothetical protein
MRTEVTPQKINKVMESRFGFSIDYDNLTYAKAERLRNALGENIMAIKKSFGAHTAEKNAKYMELMLVKEGLDKWLGSEQGLFESEMGRSEAVLAAKDIVDSVQDMLEKISKIQNEQVPALIDTIRDQIGSEQAEQFKGAISPMLVELYSALSTAREGSDTAVRQLAGEDVGQSMDMNMSSGDAGLGGDSDFDDEDMFGAEPSAAGGAVGDLDQPELGRERRAMGEGRADVGSSTVKSIYYPDKTQSPIKKSRFAYDRQGETNFKKYPDQTSRPAGMNPDPASRYEMDEAELDEMFAFDTKGKDRGPRDTGSDELARRAKLGKNPITRHAPDYKEKDKFGDRYKVAGIKQQELKPWERTMKESGGMDDDYDDDIDPYYQGYAGEEPDAEIVTTPQGNEFEWHYADGETDATFVYPGGEITVAYDNTARAFDTDNMQTDDKVARHVFSSYGKNLPKDEVEIGKLIDKIIDMKKRGMTEGDMEEGAGVMHFKAQQAKADGKDSFKLGNKEFPVK